MTDYVRATRVAAELGVSGRTVINFINRGHFPGAQKIDPSKRNSPYRIPIQAYENFKAWLKANQH